MTISSVGFGATALGQSFRTLTSQLETLQSQLTTGKKSTTYSGMGTNEGFAIGARAQLANIDAFTDTMAKVNTVIGTTNTALQSLVTIGSSVRSAASSVTQTLGTVGQTVAQQTAKAQLSSMFAILNTQAGDRYVFSGAAISTPAVADMDDVLDGKGMAAGLKQIISERKQADLGTSGLGRLVVSAPTTTSVAVSEDAAPSVFGMKLASVATSIAGATVSGPSGSPPSASIDLGVSNAAAGDQVSFKFNMPDGTTETMTLTASTSSPPPAGGFTIGATPDVTATNIQTALTSSLGTLANTSLVAASAMQASKDFFADPPQRVSGTPATATANVAGTPADTVQWYTGENGTGSARATAVARVDQSLTVEFGARANEEAIRNQLATIAAYAVTTISSSDPNAQGQIQSLSQRVTNSLTQPSGQRVSDIVGSFSAAQSVMKDAAGRQSQAQALLQGAIDEAENVSPNEVAAQLLAVQNSLQASYQTTSMLSQLSLVKFL